jgi:hypothetical protein
MLNRATVSALLKAVILATALCVIAAVSLGRVELLGAPSGDRPHGRRRGGIGKPVQGDA